MEVSQRSRPKPCRRSLGVTERGRLLGPRGECEPGSPLGGSLVSERHEHREAVEPFPVQLTEGGRQRGVVILRRRRLMRDRLDLPGMPARISDCKVYSPWATCFLERPADGET